MKPLSRRMFLKRGSAAVVLAGVASSMPTLTEAGDTGQGVAASAAAELPEGSNLAEPVIAHLRDLGRGEIGLFVGEREITFQDPHLAARIFNASR
jgi:hypothetical protein